MLDKFRTPMLFVRLFGCLPVVVCLLVGSRRKYSLAGVRHGRALEIFLNDGIESNFVLLCCWEAKNIFLSPRREASCIYISPHSLRESTPDMMVSARKLNPLTVMGRIWERLLALCMGSCFLHVHQTDSGHLRG